MFPTPAKFGSEDLPGELRKRPITRIASKAPFPWKERQLD